MAHFALCSRVDRPSTAPTTLDPDMRPHHKKHAKDPLTWQQQEDLDPKTRPKRRYRGRKASKFVPLDLEATATQLEATAVDNAPIVPQLEVKVLDTELKARGKARTRVSPHHSKQPSPHNSPLRPQGHDNVAKSPRTKRKKRKPRAEHTSEIMTAKPAGVYVPPHLRKRAAAPTGSKADVRLGDLGNVICISSTPPAPVKSQLDQSARSQVSPNKNIPKNHTPPSPPITIEEPPNPVGGCAGYDDPKPVQPAPPPKRNESPPWPRAPKAPKARHVWIKHSEIPKKLSAGSQSDGGITFKSDSKGDPSYDVRKLIDWNGDWLPPPEEWAARKGFISRHFSQVIEQWANEHSQNCTKLVDIDSPAFFGIQKEDGQWVSKDLVPRYWLHETIDNDSPRKFWKELLNRAPAPMSDLDIMDPPYWERWEDGQPDDCFMTTLVVPEARIDPADTENELESPFAMLCVEERLARIYAIKEDKKRREHAKRNRPIPVSKDEGPPMPDRRLKPKANIYLRPVQPADIPGIMTIYNYYAKNTVHAAELEEQTEAQIRFWIDHIVHVGLPCLVAVSRRNQRKCPQDYVTETIVGFAYLSEPMDLSGMYRFTFELDVYVHPGYIHQGIGKCLLDQMMHMSNTGYNKKGGYEWVNEFEYLKNGKSRTIKTILANVHYERGENVEWVTGYLGEFGFKRAGRLSQIGHKAGKVVDKVIFQLQTTEVIDPLSIPMVQD